MSESPSSRRQFLQGEAARRAAEQVLFDAAGKLQPAEAAALAPTIEFQVEAMACRFAIFLNRDQAGIGADAALEALGLVADLESQLTVYRDSSEVSLVNREAVDRDVALEPQLFQLLQRAQALSLETEGAFDITSGPLAKVWGFFRRDGRVPDEAALAEALAKVGPTRWRLDESAATIRFDRPGVEINLGAIGKGYALDRVGQALRQRGVEDFLIHGGASSVLASGQRCDRERAWPLGLGHPIRPRERIGLLELDNQSLGTSGSGNQFFRHKGKRLGHILDPRTGWPVEGVWSVTVLAPEAADADALATAFFVLGVEAAAAYVEKNPAVSAVFVLPDEPNRTPNVQLVGEPPFRPLGPNGTSS